MDVPGFRQRIEGALEGGEREADHVGKGAFEVFNDPRPVFLDRVSTGLIERMNRVQVTGDVSIAERVESHVGGFGETAAEAVLKAEEADTGDDLVGVAGEVAKERCGLSFGSGFAEDPVSEGDLGVGAEHEGVGVFAGDGAGFGVGVGEADFARGEVGMLAREFGRVGDVDRKRDIEFPKQFTAAWGSRGEDESEGVHGLVGLRGAAGEPPGAVAEVGLLGGGSAEEDGSFSSSTAHWAASESFLRTPARMRRRSKSKVGLGGWGDSWWNWR